MRTTLLLTGCLILTMTALTCQSDLPPAPPAQLVQHLDTTSGCLSHAATARTAPTAAAGTAGQSKCLEATNGTESMYAELIDGVLRVYHQNAFYQCCLKYAVSYSVEDRYITATESDTGQVCDCTCLFNLESTFAGITPYATEDWIVTLVGIGGDTVGVDTVPHNGTMKTEVVGHDLHIEHLNARLNCCPKFYVEYELADNRITAMENDSLNGCHCLCFRNLESVLYDLEPQQYIVTLVGGKTTPYAGDTVGVDTVVIAP